MSIRLLCLGLWLASQMMPVSVAAQQPTPGLPGYYPGPMASPYYQYQNPAPAPGNYNLPPVGQQPYGARPPWGYPSYPAAYPAAPGYQPQQPAQVQASRPYLETSIESTEAYVHQNLVMTIQVISTVNLKTVVVQLQDTDDFIFRQLGDATTVSTRTQQGQREIVNTWYYQLTPLRSGRIELEPVRVTGIMDNTPYETSYDVVASQPVQLTVSDPVSSVQPWLPLHELELSASLSNDERIGEGEPLTLTIEQRAVGMSGTQLPSLEAQLQAPGHRLYREKSEFQGIISRQGTLVGTRIDRFTLVPQQGNRVEIPAIRVAWWNVDRQRKETAVLPGRLLNERDRQPGEEGLAAGGEYGEATASWLMWLSLLAIAFLLGRFWPRLAPGLRRSGRWLWQWLGTVSEPLHRHLKTVLVRLSPQRNLHRIRRIVGGSLPRSARLWFCVRSADEEQDADDWSQVLRFLVNRRLGLPAHLPMSELAEHIIEIHPGADPDKIRSLLGELEAALFAGHTMRDFDTWKKAFKQQVRPRLFAGWHHRQRDLRAAGLPSLNPTIT
ncbi:MAG: BatD family protein [Pseudomonadota bacterium]|nr:BatD family protein [Pseudomonadota bacterium]